MSGKPVLYYFYGRGKMESIRWLLAAAGVEFDEVYVSTREQYEKMIKDGDLMFHQLPLVEMDGMKLVQTKAILTYIAEKHNLLGKDLKERVIIEMYTEGIRDLMTMIMSMPFLPQEQQEKHLNNIQNKSTGCYLPVYEKALANGQFLVGNQMSCADVLLLEGLLMLEERLPSILRNFPKLQAFQGRMKAIPNISKFLQPGSQRKSPPDEKYVKTVKEVLSHIFS
ncbi:glutathione S-transferase 3 [Chanos chanos]|uniref:glutathione transferase n=1 Tax=Chanos chanos TaxID=29144 RepID=A0A6J2V3J9_CHACN|nr:glutathione S-transferase 3-like [Chanos chanos]